MHIPIIDTYKTNKEAKQTLANAQDKIDNAKRKMERAHERATRSLENLGEVKLKISSECIGKFVELHKFFTDTQIDLKITGQGLMKAPVKIDFNVKELQKVSTNATEILQGGVASLSAGALAGVAAYGAVATLGTALTGTAIAALSGAAAKSATLAWFGGGSLAAGCAGIAGGTLVLGGIVLAPVLLVADSIFNAKAQERLAEAKKIYQEAKLAAEKMNTVRDFYYHVETIADDYINFLGNFRGIYDGLLNEMGKIVDRLKRIPNASANDLTKQEDKTLYITWLMTQILFNILKTPLLKEKGIFKKEIEIEPKAANVLEASREITNEFNNAYVSGNEISNATIDKFYALTGAARPKTASTAGKEVNEEKGRSTFSSVFIFWFTVGCIYSLYHGDYSTAFGLGLIACVILCLTKR